MIVLFGKGGAGKNTISNAALSLIQRDEIFSSSKVINIDLDICIPSWMKINFIETACSHVQLQIYKMKSQSQSSIIFVIITFSFINDDIRYIFRQKFPYAIWVLVDVSEELSQERM